MKWYLWFLIYIFKMTNGVEDIFMFLLVCVVWENILSPFLSKPIFKSQQVLVPVRAGIKVSTADCLRASQLTLSGLSPYL